MLIVGINDTHDASACLIKDGKLISAAAEERFRRVKMIGSYPKNAIRYVLKSGGYTSSDVDHVAVGTKILPGSLFAAQIRRSMFRPGTLVGMHASLIRPAMMPLCWFRRLASSMRFCQQGVSLLHLCMRVSSVHV